MLLSAYLQEHFVDKSTFATLVGISIARLDQLIVLQAIPGATYTCDGGTVRSAAFGVDEAGEVIAGEYFRPECVRWAKIANDAAPGSEQTAVLEILTAELRTALDTSGLDLAGIESRIEGYLPGFLDGTFGLCVADPATGAGIARKEILQERLTALTANGNNPTPAGVTREELAGLIDDYAKAAMPFSPVEYPRSSRKRLVDDLRLQLGIQGVVANELVPTPGTKIS